MGGTSWSLINDPVNLLLLCAACHVWVENNRRVAIYEKWLLTSRWLAVDDPAAIPAPLRRRYGCAGESQVKRTEEPLNTRPF
jgi:hypothetical protein